jgi:hypothetical protein
MATVEFDEVEDVLAGHGVWDIAAARSDAVGIGMAARPGTAVLPTCFISDSTRQVTRDEVPSRRKSRRATAGMLDHHRRRSHL